MDLYFVFDRLHVDVETNRLQLNHFIFCKPGSSVIKVQCSLPYSSHNFIHPYRCYSDFSLLIQFHVSIHLFCFSLHFSSYILYSNLHSFISFPRFFSFHSPYSYLYPYVSFLPPFILPPTPCMFFFVS